MTAETEEEPKGQILHVDDDPDIRLLMAGTLQEFGHRVMTAGSVSEALQLANEFTFDLCILDIRLPDGTGIDLCCKLRDLQPRVPIVYYSAYVDPEVELEALSRCGDAYLKKPVSAEELQATISGFLRRKTDL